MAGEPAPARRPTWARELAAEQPALGPVPGAAGSGTPAGAFERGTTALARYRARTGTVTVPRQRVERLADGTEVRLGVSAYS
ncbi:hypothetical protein [Streptomyces solincola]|uniref:hypothetical protein n=1 Tax=Streptomyces solincola TaxID=2100817 RepID=UPI0011B1D040|nr:hypothetical protein [Streptomyces solincola]